jgi:hypothetical protein
VTRSFALLAVLSLAAALRANAPVSNSPSNAPVTNSAVTADLPPMPAQEKELAVSQGMLLGTMAVVLLVLAVAGGIAVYVTRRHQAVPTVKDV